MINEDLVPLIQLVEQLTFQIQKKDFKGINFSSVKFLDKEPKNLVEMVGTLREKLRGSAQDPHNYLPDLGKGVSSNYLTVLDKITFQALIENDHHCDGALSVVTPSTLSKLTVVLEEDVLNVYKVTKSGLFFSTSSNTSSEQLCKVVEWKYEESVSPSLELLEAKIINLYNAKVV